MDDTGRGGDEEQDDDNDDDDDGDDDDEDEDEDQGAARAGDGRAGAGAATAAAPEIPTEIPLPSDIYGAAEYNALLRDWVAGHAAVEVREPPLPLRARFCPPRCRAPDPLPPPTPDRLTPDRLTPDRLVCVCHAMGYYQEWATAGYSTVPDGPIPDGWAPELDTRTDPGMGGVFYYHTDRHNGAQWDLPEQPWTGEQPAEPNPEEEPEEEVPPEPVANPPTALAVDDKVMCPQGPVLYLGYVVAVAPEFLYKIHYHGWSKKHDEYVHIDNLVAHDEQGLALQAWKGEALKRAKRQKLKPKPKPKPNPAELKPPKPPFRRNKPKTRGKPRRPGRSSKRRSGSRPAPRRPTDGNGAPPGPPGPNKEANLEPPPKPVPPALVQAESDYYSGRAEVKVPAMQDELKIKMVADWGNIANRKMLLKLPHETTVNLVSLSPPPLLPRLQHIHLLS